jgi:Spy/CpxP family protein refolding chaperone
MKEDIMTSNRRRRSAVALVLVAGLTCLASLGLAACGGENAAGGAVAAAPPPATSASPPAPAPIAPEMPVASAEATAPPVTSQAPNPQGAELAEGQEHREHHHGGVPGLILMSLKDLDLSVDQQAAVDKIRADLASKMEPAKAAGKDLGETLADGVAAGKVDRAKVDAAIGKLVTQVQGVHDASLTVLDQLHAALNAQQRAKLVDEVQAHWEKWKEAHGRDETDDHQHRSGHLLGLVQELGLSQDQADKIKASFRDKMRAAPQDRAHKEVQDHLQAFATAFKADTFDAKKLSGAKAANGHMARWGATRMARFIEAATPVLTPEQRAKLAQTIRQHADRSQS